MLDDLMQDGAVWKVTDPSSDRFRQAKLKRIGENIADYELVGETMTFPEMQKLREEVDPEVFADGLDTQGFLVAHLGVSAQLAVRHGGVNYLVLVKQERPDFSGERPEVHTKLPSEYWNLNVSNNPRKTILQGMDEEIIFMRDKKFLFAGKSGYNDLSSKLVWDDLRGAVTGVGDSFDFRVGDSGFIYDALQSSANLVYGFIMPLTDIGGVTAFHLEDEFDPSSGTLKTVYRGNRLLFMPLTENGNLLPEAYTLEDGKLVPSSLPKYFSEAFARPNARGIVEVAKVEVDELF